MHRSLIPDISILQVFECAALHGYFTRADEEVKPTQSAVSRKVDDLERQTEHRPANPC